MTTAAVVPVTRGEVLESDEALQTLRRTGRAAPAGRDRSVPRRRRVQPLEGPGLSAHVHAAPGADRADRPAEALEIQSITRGVRDTSASWLRARSAISSPPPFGRARAPRGEETGETALVGGVIAALSPARPPWPRSSAAPTASTAPSATGRSSQVRHRARLAGTAGIAGPLSLVVLIGGAAIRDTWAGARMPTPSGASSAGRWASRW